MIAIVTPTSPRSLPSQRPAYRVICAWCRQEIPVSQSAQALTGTSHGICRSCAVEYFGIRLDLPAAVEV